MNNSFIHVGNDPGENLALNTAKPTLPIRRNIHKVGWKDGRMEGWEGWEGWKDGRMEGWKDGRMVGW